MTAGPAFLIGAIDAIKRDPNFVIPIFSTHAQGNARYFHELNAKDRITEFTVYEGDQLDIDLRSLGHSRVIGDQGLICFAFDKTEVHVGDIDFFADQLADLPSDPRLASVPLTRVLLAEHCRNSTALTASVADAFNMLSKVSSGSARAFRDDFSLTRICRLALARAAGLLDAPVEKYPVLRTVRARVLDGRVLVEIGTPALAELRHSNGLDDAVQIALGPYLSAFEASDRVDFRYAEPEAAPRLRASEVYDVNERIRLLTSGPKMSQLFGRTFGTQEQKPSPILPSHTSDFSFMFPYQGEFDIDPTNIIFFSPSETAQVVELLGALNVGDRNIGVFFSDQLKSQRDIDAVTKIADVFTSTVIVHRGPTWRHGAFSTPTSAKTVHQFLRAFGQVVLERPRQAPPTLFAFTQAYLSGGIRNLNDAITRCIAGGVSTFAPLSEADGVHIVVTSQGKLTPADSWDATTTVKRYLRVSDNDVVIRGWRIPFDPYSSSASVAFVAETPARASFADRSLEDEVELVLHTMGTRITYHRDSASRLIHVGTERGEFRLATDRSDPSQSSLAPMVYVVDDGDAVGARRWIGEDVFVVPLQSLSLVLLADDPLRVARFINFHLRRGSAGWIYDEASDAVRAEVAYSPFRGRLEALPAGTSVELHEHSFDFSRPRVRRNYEIGVTGKVRGTLQPHESKLEKHDIHLSFTAVLRPLGRSRISRVSITDLG